MAPAFLPALAAACLALYVPGRACAADASLDLSGSVDLVSDYAFRGISLSDEKPAVQAELTLAHASGLYLDVWSSTIPRTDGGAHAELDFGIGYAWDPAPAIEVDLTALYYSYPSDPDWNYGELTATLTYAKGRLQPQIGFAIAPAQDATGKGSNIYVSAGAGYELAAVPVTLAGHIGYERGPLDYAPKGGKWDWQVGATADLGPLSLCLSYVGASVRANDGRRSLGGHRIVASAGLKFD